MWVKRRNETPRPRQLAGLSPRESHALCRLNNSFTAWSPGAGPARSRFTSTVHAAHSRINTTNNGGWRTTLHFHLSTQVGDALLFFSSLRISYPCSSGLMQTSSGPLEELWDSNSQPPPLKKKWKSSKVETTSGAQPRQEDEADGGRSAGLWL